MQARLGQASSPKRLQDPNYNQSTKENFIEAPLPVFKVTDDSSYENIQHVDDVGHRGYMLSDISDENLIK